MKKTPLPNNNKISKLRCKVNKIRPTSKVQAKRVLSRVLKTTLPAVQIASFTIGGSLLVKKSLNK